VGGDLVASGGFHFRGDEANLVDEVDGYAVLSLRAEYRIGDHARIFANLDNALDADYATFGVLGEATDVLGAAFDDPRFVGPGAPRAAWIGVRVSF
jgi:outer membrane receptor protein involved in Fe transport